jgi:hypothetical protein
MAVPSTANKVPKTATPLQLSEAEDSMIQQWSSGRIIFECLDRC